MNICCYMNIFTLTLREGRISVELQCFHLKNNIADKFEQGM